MAHAELKKSKMSVTAMKSTTRSLANFSKSGSRMKHSNIGIVSGIKTGDGKTSQLGLEYKRPPMIYLNTYQLDPRVRFQVSQVTKAADKVLDAFFGDHKYNIQESPSITLRVAAEIVRNVKSMTFNRYRIITVVTLGQKRAQSYNNAVAFLWDHERDSIVNLQRELNTAFIQVTVFGVYLD